MTLALRVIETLMSNFSTCIHLSKYFVLLGMENGVTDTLLCLATIHRAILITRLTVAQRCAANCPGICELHALQDDNRSVTKRLIRTAHFSPPARFVLLYNTSTSHDRIALSSLGWCGPAAIRWRLLAAAGVTWL